MQNFARRLMSGASLALLAFGGGSGVARASSSPVRSQLSSALNPIQDEILFDTLNVEDAVFLDASLLEADQDVAEDHIYVAYSALHSSVDSASNALYNARTRLTGLDLANTRDLQVEVGDIASELVFDQSHLPAFPAVSVDRDTNSGGFNVFTSEIGASQNDNGPNIYNNHSKFGAGAFAHSASNNATALAVGLRQGSDTSNPAHNIFFNHTDGAVAGYASASDAAELAKAHAVGVSQYATGVNTSAVNYVKNDRAGNKIGFIGAYADVHSSPETGSAIASGVHQSALAISSNAHNTVLNRGIIRAEAIVSQVSIAHADAVGIHQDPALASNATNTVENFGTIAASALAHSDHFAGASAVGIYQGASANSSAKNLVDNEANAKIEAFAVADQASNTAFALAQGVNQFGEAKTASNYVTNDGLIAAGALASDGFTAKATAQGVYQAVHATHPQNHVFNGADGVIVAGADASSANFDLAHATGVFQSAGDAKHGTAYNSVSNAGSIEAGAVAHGGVIVEAYAAGIHQSAEAGGQVTNRVDNFGNIFAVADAYSGGELAGAHATGIFQAASGHTANNYVSNHGFIGADAYAAGAGGVFAKAEGVHQLAGTSGKHFVYSANNVVDNSFAATIVAVAHASDAGGADAYAAGVSQQAFGDPAKNLVSNAGFIGASAYAHSGNFLLANATGVYQAGSGFGAAGKATNTVQNHSSATIVAFAHANQVVGSNAHEHAGAAGVLQSAEAKSALNHVDNSGFIGASARADGHGRSYAAYSASAAAIGVGQDPVGSHIANSVTNGGTIIALADAGFAHQDFADARGVVQSGHATNVQNYVSNSGLIAASAKAHNGPGHVVGISHFYTGHATAYAAGVSQGALGYDGDNTVFNHGTVIAVAHADSANYQDAQAHGINQLNLARTANNYVSNDGFVGASAVAQGYTGFTAALSADAYAAGVNQLGGNGVTARTANNEVFNRKKGVIAAFASAGYAEVDGADARGVNQSAAVPTGNKFVYSADNFVSNSGLIAAGAVAGNQTSQFRALYASAAAFGVNQDANGYTAANSVVNDGTIAGHASAFYAFGEARAQAWGVDQYAGAARTASNYVSNDGLILGSASAHNAYAAHAEAWGVNQIADPKFAHNTVVNAADGTIVALAHASDAAYQTASARAVNQGAFAAYTAQNYVSNDGFIAAHASAHGGPSIVPLSARAHAYGVEQYASGSPAFNTVDNHGHIVGLASASFAQYAAATAYGVFQRAEGGSALAVNYVSNDGIIGGIALVHDAYDASEASALGVYQHADGTTATNEVDNAKGGVIGAYGAASSAEYMGPEAKGINQTASADGSANNRVSNHGLVVAEAIAFGGPGKPGYKGTASAYGIDQSAFGSTANNYVTNDGTIAAFAKAFDFNYEARATAFAVNQELVGDSAFQVNTVHNGGVILAVASASYAGIANAHAYGVYQSNSATEWAINNVSNEATGATPGLIAAVANANHAVFGHATAIGIYQSADASELASNGVVNRGTVVAAANAAGSVEAAYAHAKGIYQSAEADNGTAVNNNVSNLGVVAAQATAFGIYSAHATARGISQAAYASYGAEAGAHNIVHNQGLVAAFATASAFSRATANARAIHQFATGYTAANYVSNDGGFIEAYAGAHEAYITNSAAAYGIDERAVGHIAKNTVVNHGSFTAYGAPTSGVIAASAFASGPSNVHALAVGVHQYADQYSGLASNHATNDGGLIYGRAHARGEIQTTTNFTGTHVTGSTAAYHATADAAGVAQYAAASHANNYVFNSGVIFAEASASHAEHAYAVASAVDQYAHVATGPGVAHNYVSNDALISARASAYGASFLKGGVAATSAHGYALGVNQIAVGNHAQNTVENHGGIIAAAYAGNAYHAVASAWGVDQYADLPLGTAHNVVNNFTGLIAATASATGALTNAYVASVTAHAFGVAQYASATLAKNTVVNHGHYTGSGDTGHVTGAILAHAHATNGNEVNAIATGVHQYAHDAFVGAANYVSNDGGLIDAVAIATDAELLKTQHQTHTSSLGASYRATSASRVYETVSARANGVDQDAHGYNARNTVLNHGTIAAYASASDAYLARADARGVNQDVGAYNGTNYVSNDALIQAHAHAENATGVTTHITIRTYPSAGPAFGTRTSDIDFLTGHASARAVGIDQFAGAHIAVNSVYNGGTVMALASASNSDNNAFADARGVNQSAGAYSANNYVDNDGLIMAKALAYSSNDQFSDGNFNELTDQRTARAFGVDQYFQGDYVHNRVVNDATIVAFASARSADAGYATAEGVKQVFFADSQGYNAVTNYNAISAMAVAHNGDENRAIATGVHQYANGGTGTMNLVGNYGTSDSHAIIDAHAHAYAAEDSNNAYAAGVDQAVDWERTNGYVKNKVINSTYAQIGGSAKATSTHLDRANFNNAYAAGIHQDASGYSHAEDLVYNHGYVSAFAKASGASITDNAFATGVHQDAHNENYFGQAQNYVTNDGTIRATAHAFGYCTPTHGADCSDGGFAHARAIGVLQTAYDGVHAFNSVYNGGNIFATATAKEARQDHATAVGIHQTAMASETGRDFVSNSGHIEAHAKATGGYGGAGAYAAGIAQGVFGRIGVAGSGTEHVFNDGYITAVAHAQAGTLGDPEAAAVAVGVGQTFNVSQGYVTDSNVSHRSINAFASAVVHSGATETAFATAAGIYAGGYAHGLALDIDNHGEIVATATARVAVGSDARARAYGIDIVNNYTASGAPNSEGYVSGEIFNNGHIGADAFASHAHNGGIATAVGVRVEARQFSAYIGNSGSIDAQAFGGIAKATGILVTSNGHDAYSSVAHHVVGHITNTGGFIFASTGDAVIRNVHGAAIGVSDQHAGNAINVENAPNEVDITLGGQSQTTIGGVDQFGLIYGNIEDSKDPADTPTWVNNIVVNKGVTRFDGSINPDLTPSSAPSLAQGGTLTIANSGTSDSPKQGILWLPSAGNSPGLGTSFWGTDPVLNVNAFTQQPNGANGVVGGAIWLDISGTHSARINANTASLGGSVVLIPDPFSLFVTTTYDVVVSPSAGITGDWSSVTLRSVSPLLSVSHNVDSTDADITLTRLAFNLVPGLTHNEHAVATGLEGGYGGCVSAQCMAFYQAIFQFDGAQYPAALNMLSDSQAGEVAQSNVMSANNFVDMVHDRMASMAGVLGAGGQIAPAGDDDHRITLWGSPYGTWDSTASSNSGPGYANSRGGIVLGADVAIDPTAFIGVAGDIENKNALDFKNGRWNDLVSYAGRGTSRGWDIALYGRWNGAVGDTPVYLQGSGSYGTYDDTTLREVELPLLTAQVRPANPSPGRAALTPGLLSTPDMTTSLMSGKFSSDVWSVYGEGGVPLDLGFGFTPYVGLRYLDSSSGPFAETSSNSTPGIAAAALNVTNAEAQSLTSYLGAQMSTELPMDGGQSLLPSVRLAWAHNFSDPWKVDAYFSGVGPSSSFEINASSWSKDAGIVDLSLSMLFQDNLLGTIGYDASLGDTQTVQSAYGRVDFKF